jgi:hypothetical protein
MEKRRNRIQSNSVAHHEARRSATGVGGDAAIYDHISRAGKTQTSTHTTGQDPGDPGGRWGGERMAGEGRAPFAKTLGTSGGC